MRAPDWWTAFVFGMAGGMTALALWADYFFMAMTIKWEAVAALATLGAVLVALYPIRRDELRRQAASRAVATSAVTALQVIATHLAHPLVSDPLALGVVSKAIDALVALLPRTEVLEPEEQVSVAAAASACEQIRNVAASMTQEPRPEHKEWLLKVVIEANDRLCTRLGGPTFYELPAVKAAMISRDTSSQTGTPETAT